MSKIWIVKTLPKFLRATVFIALFLWGNVSIAQTSPDYRNSLLDVSDNGEVIAVSGRAISDATSVTGGRYPIEFYNPESGTLISTFTGSDFGITGIELSPDGSLLAYSNNDGRFAIVDVLTAVEVAVVAAGGNFDVGYPSWSPEGSLLGTFFGSSIVIHETQEFMNVGGFYNDVSDGTVYGFDLSINNQVAISTYDINTSIGTVVIWDVDDTAETSLVKRISASLGLQIEWSPDGDKIAGVANGGILEITVEDESQRLFAVNDPNDFMVSLAWSSDGQQIAGGGRSTIYIWGVETGDLIETFDTLTTVSSVDWSLDGQYVYHTGGPSGIYRNGIPLQDAIAEEANG